nr:DUF2742 domain-containing protein [Mycobacterium sp. E342]
MSVNGRAVSWWSVHEFVAPWLAAAGDWPMAGTPAWVELPDTDPAKWAAVLDAARHWGLRVEAAQLTFGEASHAVAAAADWSAIAGEIRRRNGAHIPRAAS